MAERAKHAFGSSDNLQAALQNGTIDAYDILFLDGDTNPKVGWVDKNGVIRLVESGNDNVVIVDGESLPESGDEGKIYIFGNAGYVWNGTEFVNLCTPTDLTELEAELATKVSAEEVDAKLESFERSYEEIKYVVSHKPEGALVDYRDKEIRVMCPADTQWTLQQSGENANPNNYYIGVKAYAPSDDVVSFKEDTQKTIADETMYYFEGEFAGVEADGKKYSIIWLPVASYSADTSTWTYYGTNSADGKYIGWYYSVEWYNADGAIVASDCIRINLSNEKCHSSIEPFYVNSAIEEAKKYADTQIETKINEAVSGFEVVEF